MEFEVNDMTCGHCASRITQAVKAVAASANVDIDITSKRVKVAATTTPVEVVLNAIAEAGYTPVLQP
ncbi:heavy-metal-associated domain-containing protein [Burkholderia sp. L27(2015)]|uniref:heavy-metal-associated domain-containing protein n=1 Tax=Burkholderia sp. L27(2015) TaxID=1641858 RepID=UPI00131DAF86|nr:heavy-metal-associated domain-containing protein [Burkholderia sp. L27(2015)]